MAITQLGIYNDALRLVGETRLDSLTEDRESRYDLDGVYELGAIDKCLEVVRPKFASTTTALTGTSVASGYEFALPDDFVTIVGVYSDVELDQIVSRYTYDGSSIFCDYDTLYLRYTNNTVTEADFSPGFASVVSKFMGREICYKFDPGRYITLDQDLQDTTERVIGLEGEKEPATRPAKEGSELTSDWRKIYNGALMILGKDKLPAGDTDHPYRVKCDTSRDEGVVTNVMEDTAWTFGITSSHIEYNPSIEPVWGYQFAFDKPDNMLRLDGIWSDEYFNNPLKEYEDEGDIWMTSVSEIYVKYVDNDFVANPAVWPNYFSRLISAKIAYDIVMGVDPTKVDHALTVYEDRKSSAMSNDAMASPPRLLTAGNWLRSRNSSRNYSRGYGRSWPD